MGQTWASSNSLVRGSHWGSTAYAVHVAPGDAGGAAAGGCLPIEAWHQGDPSRHSQDCHSGINNISLVGKNKVRQQFILGVCMLRAPFSNACKTSTRPSAMFPYLHHLTSPKTALF